MIRKSVAFICLFLLFNKMFYSNPFLMKSDSLTNCKTQNLKPWIYFQYDVCLHLIVNENQYKPICIAQFFDKLTADGIVIYQKSLTHMKNRNFFNESKTKCESYLLVMENPQEWLDEINQPVNKTNKKLFFPFSRLYFFSLYGRDFSVVGTLTNFLYRNGLFGYKFNFDSTGQVISIRDIVNNFLMISSPNFTDLSHPLVDVNDKNKQFAVSVFNCPPHIVYLDEKGSRVLYSMFTMKSNCRSNKTTSQYNKFCSSDDDFSFKASSPLKKTWVSKKIWKSKMDGMEYRFLTHVLKKWKIKFLQQNESLIPFNPFGSMLTQLENGYSQMVMCGLWLNIMHYSNKDLTTYFDYNCNTWIAPKPKKLDPAALVYLALSTPVWGLYLFCFVLTVILLTIISKIEEDIKKTKIVSSHFGRSLLEAANTATSHGILNFPKQISVQILLISWILLNLLVGLGYTTIYTSRLASPGYMKPIDTFEDFVEQGISWVTRHQYDSVLQTLNESTRPAFHKMYKNFVRKDTEKELVETLKTGRYGVFMSIRSHKYAVDIERITLPSSMGIWNLFRFMKSCYYSHFSSFGLQKHSPYTTLFNAHIKRYQECGIIKHWYVELYTGKTWMNTLFDTHQKDNEEPDALQLWDVKGAFLVLLAGLSVATVSFLLEWIYVKLRISFINGWILVVKRFWVNILDNIM